MVFCLGGSFLLLLRWVNTTPSFLQNACVCAIGRYHSGLIQRSICLQWTVVNAEMLACSRCAYRHQAEHSSLNNISMWPHKAQGTMEKKCWKECMKQEGEKLWNAVFWAWTSQCSNDIATARAAWDGSAQDWTCSNLLIRPQLIIDQREAHVILLLTAEPWDTCAFWGRDKHPVQMDTHLPCSSHGRPDGPSWSQWVTTGHRKTWKWERDLWEEGL